MKTLLLEKHEIHIAVELLSRNQLVAIPTETVYGLAGNAESDVACQKIYRIKNRPADNPLIVHCDCIDMAKSYMKENPSSEELIMIERALKILRQCSPGPITVIVPSSEKISKVARAQGSTAGIRIPQDMVARKIISSLGKAVAAPSANVSGRPSATNALMVWETLQGMISAVVDGGNSALGLESSIVDCTHTDVHGALPIVREGTMRDTEISQKTGLRISSSSEIQSIINSREVRVVPGSKYKHYAPNCQIVAIESEQFSNQAVQEQIQKYSNPNLQIAVAYVHPQKIDFGNVCAFSRQYDSWQELEKNLYELFVESDRRAIEMLFITVSVQAEHPALMDRITRAMQE